MNDAERELINGLFDRMRKFEGIEKDQDAADLVRTQVGLNPDAPYLLAQSVLVQEQALQRAEARIRELQQELSDAQAVPAQSQAAPQLHSREILGKSATSVPAVGQGRKSAMSGAPAGGGFMAQALSTAAGVAGGMLLASGISSLLSSEGADASQVATTETNTESTAPGVNENSTSDSPFAAESQSEAVTPTSTDDGDWGDWGDFGSDIDL